MTGTSLSPVEALADELGAVAARIEREIKLQLAAGLAEIRQELSAVRARAAETELRAVTAERTRDDLIASRLSSVRDGEPGPRGAEGPPGPPGDSVKGDPGEPGQTITASDVHPLVVVEVEKAVAALPVPADGKDADPRVIAELVAGEVERAVKALPPPADGHTPSEAELAALVEPVISRAVAALPRPKDGADGKSVEPEEIVRMVAAAVSQLPPAEPGEKGEPGERGPEGPAGKLGLVKEWQRGVHYESHIVTHGGSTYQALRDTADEPPHDDWRCIALAGRDGVSGRGFVIRGTWNATLDYRGLEVVALNGASFVARHDEPGPCPGEGWQLIASQGKRGPQGERGLMGTAGARGLPGPSVIAIDIDANGLLTLTNGDGSSVSCDLYPLLAQVR